MNNLILSEKLSKTIYENEEVRSDQGLIDEILDFANNSERSEKFLKALKEHFKFKHHVGILQTLNFRIQVLPKIWKDDNSDKSKAILNLIKLLFYAFTDPSSSIPEIVISPETNKLDIFELLIRFYATTLEDQLSMGVYRKYNRVQEESRYLRGKLNLMKQLRRIDQSKFNIDTFRFSGDNDLNRFFAYATECLLRWTKDPKNAEILSSIQLHLDSEDIPTSKPKGIINFNRLNERFQIPYTYAKLLLDSMIPLPGGNDRSMMMIFDMNEVFEAFFAKFVTRNKESIFNGMGISESDIKIQRQEKNFIYGTNGTTDLALRYTRPDVRVVISNTNSTLVFDTKYKILNSLEITVRDDHEPDEISVISSGDLYQMFTYSEIYKSNGTILVFPGKETKLSDPYRFTKGGRFLRVCMINMDLSHDDWEDKLRDQFREEFKKIMDNS